MPFTALRNLIFSTCDTQGCLETVSPTEIMSVFSAWINAGKPTPQGWVWSTQRLPIPLDFLLTHFDPSFVPLIEMLDERPKDPNTSEKLLHVLFETQKLTTQGQARLLKFFNLEVSEDLLGCVVKQCRAIPRHLLQCFPKYPDFFEACFNEAISHHDYVTANTLLLTCADYPSPTPDDLMYLKNKQETLMQKLTRLRSFLADSDEKETHPVTLDEFENAGIKFLTKHDLSDIPSIFETKVADCFSLSDAFLIEPTIRAYLARDTFQMTKHDYPAYDESEKEIYLAMHKTRKYPDIFYRTEFHRNNNSPCYQLFYATSDINAAKLNIKGIRDHLGTQHPIYLLEMRDGHQVGEALTKMAFAPHLRHTQEGFTFVISAASIGIHVACVLSVISVTEKRVLYHVLLDSLSSFRLDLFEYHLHSWIKRYPNYSSAHSFIDKLPPPLIDASLGIQKNGSEDNNCSLYTVAMCKALSVALQDKTLQTFLSAKAPPENIVTTLHKAIKPLTPFIFSQNEDGEYVPRAYEQRKRDAFSIRWKTGQLSFLETTEEISSRLKTTITQLERLVNTLSLFQIHLSQSNRSRFFKPEKIMSKKEEDIYPSCDCVIL